ncbi:MAG TPA: hypothetical protein VGA80_15470, partial [Flavobacteriaceae bacterium]
EQNILSGRFIYDLNARRATFILFKTHKHYSKSKKSAQKYNGTPKPQARTQCFQGFQRTTMGNRTKQEGKKIGIPNIDFLKKDISEHHYYLGS